MPKKSPLTGKEQIYGTELSLKNAQVLAFWRWAFSDLRMNDIRGVFAEWLVALLLDIPLNTRDSWGEWDLTTENGVSIEVKSSAYLQAWKQKRVSRISFSGLRGKRLNAESNLYAKEKTYNADLYAFCAQIEKDPKKWDALDLEQWRFYLLKREELIPLQQNSISQNRLAKLTPEMNAEEFQRRAKELIAEIAQRKTNSRNLLSMV